ncbi:uncharacterized protein DNG_05558 [Cephalotrichum gorgonifer]|uniref:Uncharacterized protein n=1 Tax=Cephalotrichum gorgonifer TaxID=2041049 RepID=A0AAE8SVK5_9PEZI|nr:uncharacterized protein DNG_05558 [Cephalotrichum gorgonifer]
MNNRRQFPQPDPFMNGTANPGAASAAWNTSRSPVYPDMRRVNSPPSRTYSQPSGVSLLGANYGVPIGVSGHGPPPRVETSFPLQATTGPYQPPVVSYHPPPAQTSYGPLNGTGSPSTVWNAKSAMYSPTDSVDDILGSSNMSDCSMDDDTSSSPPPGTRYREARGGGVEIGGRNARRRPSNRDEFDGPHHFLQRPSAEYVAMQERELPHLPTNLPIQEQDHILRQMHERLSKCAFDFVAKYQFPVPLAANTRPVERAQDRDWVEWVYLLKRLATKRRIPARVLYNGQIKQFVPTLEHSLEMRYASRGQGRPLKDDRHMLQLLSAGIQVAKILKDASAMDFMDRLYCSTEEQIHKRAPVRYWT